MLLREFAITFMRRWLGGRLRTLATLKHHPDKEDSHHMASYPLMSSEAWDSRMQYLREDLERLRDPRAKTPDLGLLVIGPHGPFRELRVTPDPDLRRPSIGFKVMDPARKERFASAPIFSVMSIHLAFGGGCSLHDTGKGLAYPNLFSGYEVQMLLRLITDAGPEEVAKQEAEDGPRLDYHNFQHDFCSKTTAEGERKKGYQTKTPSKEREEAVQTSLRYFRKNHPHSEIKTSEAEYEAAIRAAYAQLDGHRGGIAARA
jgi:hypothetical protein